MTLVYACIAPHGGEVIPKLAGKKKALFGPTRTGLLELAEEVKRADPDTIVLATPHNLRVGGHIGVVTAENSSGRLVEGGEEVRLKAKCDVALAKLLVEESRRVGLPVVGANYGTAEGRLSDLPMDWGALVPLWFFLKRNRLKSRVVLVTPSREIPLHQNRDFGRVVANVSEGYGKRVAFVASADQAHAHKKSGPYGFSPRAAEYDLKVVQAIERSNLAAIMRFSSKFVDQAKPDSLWQMAMLVGVLQLAKLEGRLISYQVPTYYGMLCASYARKS